MYGSIILEGMTTQDGHYYAQSMLTMFGPRAVPVYNLIRSKGSQAVLDVMQKHQGFWASVTAAVPGDPAPQVKAWIEDFIDYEKRIAEEEGAIEPQEGQGATEGQVNQPPPPPQQ
jgi:hypothetical protein